MPRLAACLTLICVVPLAACSPTGGASDGAGFRILTPSPATRAFIIENDRPFAEEVAAHNATCRQLPACQE